MSDTLFDIHAVLVQIFTTFFVLAFYSQKSVIARDYGIRVCIILFLMFNYNRTLGIWIISILLGLSAFTCFGLFIMKWLPGLYRYTHKRIDIRSDLYNRDIAAFFMRSGLYMFLLGGYLWT